MIKTVICDLGGVCFTDGSAIAIAQIAAIYGLREEAVGRVLMGDLGSEYRMGEITADEFWNRARQHWGLERTNEEIAAIWLQAYEPMAGMPELLDRLRAAGYELIFLSDNVQERVDYLEETYGFLCRFDDGVFSHRVGMRKPDPRIYALALEKASHPAAECVFVDDKPDMLTPARQAGMAVIAFDGAGKLQQELASLGVVLQ
jgi:epoxide hydrolase-like predicted phosphatase